MLSSPSAFSPNTSTATTLRQAAHDGNIEQLKAYFSQISQVNVWDQNHVTPLTLVLSNKPLPVETR